MPVEGLAFVGAQRVVEDGELGCRGHQTQFDLEGTHQLRRRPKRLIGRLFYLCRGRRREPQAVRSRIAISRLATHDHRNFTLPASQCRCCLAKNRRL